MKPGTERAFGRAETPVLIVPGSAISTQQLPKNVLLALALNISFGETGTNGVFAIWESPFMSVFKIGRRYGLFGCRQATQLTSLAKYVLQAAFQPRKQFAATALQTLKPVGSAFVSFISDCRNILQDFTDDSVLTNETHK
jgi:hypothetical protein